MVETRHAASVLIALVGLAFLAVTAAWDWRTRRVPNWLTLSALAISVMWRIAFGGWSHFTWLVWGGALAAWGARWLGGADAKIFLALGALWSEPDYWLALGGGVALAYGVLLLARQTGSLLDRARGLGWSVWLAARTRPPRSADSGPLLPVVALVSAIYWMGRLAT